MDGQMNKEQVIEATIGVLSDISVPVRLTEQIVKPIEGAINNLAIALQMIRMEAEAAKEPDEQTGQEPANPENLFGLAAKAEQPAIKPEEDPGDSRGGGGRK